MLGGTIGSSLIDAADAAQAKFGEDDPMREGEEFHSRENNVCYILICMCVMTPTTLHSPLRAVLTRVVFY